jgi:hypothetical protein
MLHSEEYCMEDLSLASHLFKEIKQIQNVHESVDVTANKYTSFNSDRHTWEKEEISSFLLYQILQFISERDGPLNHY